MQVATGVQGDHGFVVCQVAGAVVGHHILVQVQRRQVMVRTQGLAGGDQVGVVLQAGQLLAGLQQAAAEVAFAGAPVQPVAGLRAEAQVAGEGFDLLPFATGDGNVEAVGGSGQVGGWEVAKGSELLGLPGQLWEWGGQGRGGAFAFGVCQGALAQVGGKFWMRGFPL